MVTRLKAFAKRVFRRAERATETDLAYVVRGGSWLAMSQVVFGLIALGLSVAFAHLVDKSDYGTYRFLLSVFWVLTAFSLTGLPTALSRAVAQGFDGSYARSFRLSLLGSLPLVLIAFLGAGYYAYMGNAELSMGFVLIGVLGPFMQASILYGSFLEGKKDFMRMALYGIFLNGATGLLLLCLMAFTDDPLAFLGGYLFGNAVAGGVLCLLALRHYNPAGPPSTDLLSLSKHFSAMNVLSTCAQQADKLLVFHYLGAIEVAVYTFATALPEQAKTAVNSVATLAFPKFASRSFDEIRTNFWNRYWLFTGGLAIAAGGYVALAPYLFGFFFPTYPEAVPYSQLFAVSLIFISNAIPLSLLEAKAAKRELYIFNIASPIFQIAVLFIGILSAGLLGAIVARIVGRGFNFFLLVALAWLRIRRG